MDFLAPFKFYRNEPRVLTVQVALHAVAGAVLADCRLVGHRTLPNQAEPQATVHFRGRVRLTPQAPHALAAAAPGAPAGTVFEAADIYRAYFHGPAYQVLERAWLDGNKVFGRKQWRRKRDSNPRATCAANGFQDRRFQPLTHSSGSLHYT